MDEYPEAYVKTPAEEEYSVRLEARLQKLWETMQRRRDQERNVIVPFIDIER
jgi:hypothetical protein